MAVTRTQTATAQQIPNVKTLAVALASPAAAGALLVSAVAVNKSAGTVPAPSAGWTVVDGGISASVSLAMAWRVAAGTAADACTWTWGSSQNAVAWIGEYAGFGLGVITPPPSSSAFTTEALVRSVDLGPAAAVGDAVAVAAVGADTWANWGLDATWSGSFTRLASIWATDGRATDVGAGIADRIVSGPGALSTTATAVGGAGDQASGIIAVFGAVVPVPVVQTQWCGGVTATTAEVVVKLDGGSRGRLVVSASSDLSSPSYSAPATVDGQLVLRLSIDGLTPDAGHHYGVEVDGVLLPTGRGRFRTMATAATSFAFALVSCAAPAWGVAATGARIVASPARFLIQDGDLGYPDETTALTVSGLRSSYDTLGAATGMDAVFAAMPVVHVWDDHDCGDDGSSPSVAAAAQVYREREAHHPLADATAVYQTWTCGRARFVVLDCRSGRDPGGDPDDASKSMLGAAQLAWLEDVLAEAEEPVIFIVSSVPWNDPRDPRGDDGWCRYTTEQAALVDGWRRTGVLGRLYVLSGDAHMVAADDGTNSPGGIPCVHAGAYGHGSRTIKGGTFSEGAVAGREQYGLITVTDTGGSTIVVDFAGYGEDGRVAVDMSTTFPA